MEDDVVDRQASSVPAFRFEASWVHEENCDKIVQNAWNLSMAARSGIVAVALHDVAADLWDRSRNIFGNIEKRIKQLKKALEGCRRRGISRDTVDREAILKYKLQKLED
jgi:hypothetical protein